jgi:hypothetical protein
MSPWQQAFHKGFAPLLSDAELIALKAGLISNDPALLQRQTTRPTVTDDHTRDDELVTGACPVAYSVWKGSPGEWDVLSLEQAFLSLCCYSDDSLRDLPMGYREFLVWWDTANRRDAVPLLLKEVNAVLKSRKEASHEPT